MRERDGGEVDFIFLNCLDLCMLTKDDIITKLRDLKPILYREFSVKEIGLFGSYSNDTFTKDSDIDILVELEKPIGWKFFTLEIYLESIFGCKIDLVTKNALKVRMRIDESAIPPAIAEFGVYNERK